jgi:tRNA U34 5-methylaminomethyl-2-thiouridine-forming methyltransferase MnmC
LHLRQQRLLERASLIDGTFVIWDVGLGAAANAIAVLELFREFSGFARIGLHSFDTTLAPLRFALDHMEELGYLHPYAQTLNALPASTQSVGPVQWQFHPGDFCELVANRARRVVPPPHAILYDPYSLVSNRAMWTLEHFNNLRACCTPDVPCLLTNYTRSTAARVTVLLAGFFVGRGAAVGDKSETTVAATHRELLDSPLDQRWLERVRRSSDAAPVRGSGRAQGAISVVDYETLMRHPQFAVCPG